MYSSLYLLQEAENKGSLFFLHVGLEDADVSRLMRCPGPVLSLFQEGAALQPGDGERYGSVDVQRGIVTGL